MSYIDGESLYWNGSTVEEDGDLGEQARLRNLRMMRKGKWTEEEESYTMKLIEAFVAGVLPLPQGTTLRSFLSEKLCCDPMRITKKFAGSNGIGKQIFQPSMETEKVLEVRKYLERDIDELEKRFFARIDSAIMASAGAYQMPPPLRTHSNDALSAMGLTSGYRVVLPSENRFELKSYAEFLEQIALTKADSSIISPVPSIETSLPAHVPIAPKYLAAPAIINAPVPVKEERCYINAGYRVHGFDIKKEPPVRKEHVPLVSTNKRKAEGGEKQPRAKAAPKQGGSTATRKPKVPKAKSSTLDLHASALLMDFFRAAHDKEGSSGDSSDDADGQPSINRMINDDNYRVVIPEVKSVQVEM